MIQYFLINIQNVEIRDVVKKRKCGNTNHHYNSYTLCLAGRC